MDFFNILLFSFVEQNAKFRSKQLQMVKKHKLDLKRLFFRNTDFIETIKCTDYWSYLFDSATNDST